MWEFLLNGVAADAAVLDGAAVGAAQIAPDVDHTSQPVVDIAIVSSVSDLSALDPVDVRFRPSQTPSVTRCSGQMS
jgi:hypothetical protein